MPAGDTSLEVLNSLQAPYLFQSLPSVLDQYAWVFVAAGFLILVGGHQWRIHEAGNDGHSITRAWYRTLLVMTFMMLSPKLCEMCYLGVCELVSDNGMSSPGVVTRKCVRLAMSTPELESVFARYSNEAQRNNPTNPPDVGEAAREGGLWEYTKAWWVALGDEATDLKHGAKRTFRALTDGPAMVASQSVCLVKAAAIFLTSVLTTMFLLFSAMLAHTMDLIRYVLLMVGAALLPPFVAGYNTRSFCGQGHRFVTGMISLMLWPVWWMLGHIGTKGLFDAYVGLLANVSVGANNGAGFAALYDWSHIDETVGKIPQGAVGPATGLMSMGASTSFLYLGLVAFGAFGLFSWVFLVTVGGPFLGHKLVTAGSAAFSGGLLESGRTVSPGRAAEAVVEVRQEPQLKATGNTAPTAGVPGGTQPAPEVEPFFRPVGARVATVSDSIQEKTYRAVGRSPTTMVEAARTATHTLREAPYEVSARMEE